MKLGKRQQAMLETITHRGYWCYGLGFPDDAGNQRVCEGLEKKGLLERFERKHPLGFGAMTTAWRLTDFGLTSWASGVDPL
jgi:hypothetical protein